MKPASVAERLEVGVRVEDDASPFIIVQALDDATVGGVDDELRASEVVADDAVSLAALDQVGRDVGLVGINEAADDLVVAVSSAMGFRPSWYRKPWMRTVLTCLPIFRFCPSIR